MTLIPHRPLPKGPSEAVLERFALERIKHKPKTEDELFDDLDDVDAALRYMIIS